MPQKHGQAFFIRKFSNIQNLKPFSSNGELDPKQVEEREIVGTALKVGYRDMQTKRLAYLSLKSHFKTVDCLDNDHAFRQAVSSFWMSAEGQDLLSERFGRSTTSGEKLTVVPTHVTRRQAPPDHLSLVHIDYPSHYTALDLWKEWSDRWHDILPLKDSELLQSQQSTVLVGVLTIWVLLSSCDENCPLWVADASTMMEKQVYRVGGRQRSSVGLYFSESMQWYTAPRMQRFDAWIFDTMHSPHVAPALLDAQGLDTTGRRRRSAEVRCLILLARDEDTHKPVLTRMTALCKEAPTVRSRPV